MWTMSPLVRGLLEKPKNKTMRAQVQSGQSHTNVEIWGVHTGLGAQQKLSLFQFAFDCYKIISGLEDCAIEVQLLFSSILFIASRYVIIIMSCY